MTEGLEVAEVIEDLSCVFEEEGLVFVGEVCFEEDSVEIGEDQRRLRSFLWVWDRDDGEKEVDDGLGIVRGLILMRGSR